MQPEPDGTGGTPASTPAPGRKWNCRSGVGTLLSEYQNAPPSAMFDVTGPLLKSLYSRPASSIKCFFAYLSRL